jgi:hypothetical protein
MDKLIKYLKEELKLSDDLVKVVINNIKVKYVVPTYYYDDLLFTDFNVLFDEDKDDFSTEDDINEYTIKQVIEDIFEHNKDAVKDIFPNNSIYTNLKIDDEYWAIYKDLPPINVVVKTIKREFNFYFIYSYNIVSFLNKATNKTFSFYDHPPYSDDIYLFNSRQEAVKFYRDKFNLN